MLIAINHFFILISLILGFLIVKEDLSRGKIRNILVGSGLFIGFLLYAAFALWSLAEYFNIVPVGAPVSLSYIIAVFVNFLASVMCGYLIWRNQLWSAGDAKFFIMLSFLLPLRFYENGYLPYFPSSALLINIFIPIFLFLIFRMVMEAIMNFRKFFAEEAASIMVTYARAKEKALNMMRHKRRILAVAGAFFITSFFIPFVKYQTIFSLSSHVIAVIAALFVFYFSQKYLHDVMEELSKKRNFIPIAMLFIGTYFLFGLLYFRESLILGIKITLEAGIVFFLLFFIFRRISDFYIKQNDVTIIAAKDLKPRMVISEELAKIIESDASFSQELGELYPEGISDEQAAALKEWFLKQGKIYVPIYKTFSFAPYIFAGAIITIVLKQSVMHLFLSLIR